MHPNSFLYLHEFHIFPKTFENVTILFSDVVGFTKICTKISPMDVVTLLNSMYIKFDQLSVKYRVYKVCVEFSV